MHGVISFYLLSQQQPVFHRACGPVQLVLIASTSPARYAQRRRYTKFHFPQAIYLMDNAQDAEWEARIRPCL